jgi:hypothetical protein
VLEFGGKVREAEHDFIGCVAERALPVLKIKKHADPAVDDLLEGVGRLDLFSTEAGFLGHDKDLKRRARLECVHKSEEAGPLDKFRAGNPIIAVDMVIGNGPAFPLRVGSRVLPWEKARHAPRKVRMQDSTSVLLLLTG